MAPSYSRQLIVFSVPTIAVLLSYFWFKRKRSIQKKSDPGEKPREQLILNCEKSSSTPTKKEFEEIVVTQAEDSSCSVTPYGTPERSRTLSTPSTPIDIVIPRELRSQKTSPVIISDEDLDLEIERIKLMRSGSGDPVTKLTQPDTAASSQSSSVCTTKTETPTKASKKIHSGAMPIHKKTSESSSTTRPKQEKKKSPGKMVNQDENNVKDVEVKLNSLNMGKEQTTATPKNKKEETQVKNNAQPAADTTTEERQSSERDSANHSPADVMLASPSLSCISDNHSEGSSDSGKGGSDVATPPSRTPAGDNNSVHQIYEFVLPQTLVGKLIGRFGRTINDIKTESRTYIHVKKHPDGSSKQKLCRVEGKQADIETALSLIRNLFPIKRYPDVTLEQVACSVSLQNVPLAPEHVYCKLIEGVNNDTVVSCMVTPAHFFLQQPTHPSYPHLQILSNYMELCYNVPDAPVLPTPILENTVCVALSVGQWYRAMILSSDPETDKSYVTFLDYGGYANIENSNLRQIRGDFLMLPFQAAECMLYNVKPIGGDDAEWNPEAYNLFVEFTKGAIALTQIADYTETGIPLVLMYLLVGPQEAVLLNDVLVSRGFAEYCSPTNVYDPEAEVFQPAAAAVEEIEGAVGGLVSA